jgi:ribosomal protein L34
MNPTLLLITFPWMVVSLIDGPSIAMGLVLNVCLSGAPLSNTSNQFNIYRLIQLILVGLSWTSSELYHCIYPIIYIQLTHYVVGLVQHGCKLSKNIQHRSRLSIIVVGLLWSMVRIYNTNTLILSLVCWGIYIQTPTLFITQSSSSTELKPKPELSVRKRSNVFGFRARHRTNTGVLPR